MAFNSFAVGHGLGSPWSWSAATGGIEVNLIDAAIGSASALALSVSLGGISPLVAEAQQHANVSPVQIIFGGVYASPTARLTVSGSAPQWSLASIATAPTPSVVHVAAGGAQARYGSITVNPGSGRYRYRLTLGASTVPTLVNAGTGLAVTDGLSPSCVLGSVAVNAGAVKAAYRLIDPAAHFGSTSFAPSLQWDSKAVDPSTVLASMSVAPQSRHRVATGSAPGVLYGPITLSAGSANASSLLPGLEPAYGSINLAADTARLAYQLSLLLADNFLAGTAASHIEVPDPAVILGDVSVLPGSARSESWNVWPSVAYKSLSLSPDGAHVTEWTDGLVAGVGSGAGAEPAYSTVYRRVQDYSVIYQAQMASDTIYRRQEKTTLIAG